MNTESMNIQTRYLLLTLKDDAIINQNAASGAIKDSLDFIPGSQLLGVAAGKQYREFLDQNNQSEWFAFHGANIRFMDAVPCHIENSDQEMTIDISWPMPLSLHHHKGDVFSHDAVIDANKVMNLAAVKPESERQLVQLRRGHLTPSGRMLNAVKHLTLHTAINASTQTAAKKQLFGYSSLEEGQTFVATIHFVFPKKLQKKDTQEKYISPIMDAFANCIRIGTAKGKIGSVSVEVLDLDSTVTPRQVSLAPSVASSNEVVVWLLSDTALVDEFGQYTLIPDNTLHGILPEGSQWLPEKSFIRSRQLTRRNNKRRARDPEIATISRGSVLCFKLPPNTAIDYKPFYQIGLHQEIGFGHISLNSELLSAAQPVLSASSHRIKRMANFVSPPTSSPLLTLAKHRERLAISNQEAYDLTELWFIELLKQTKLIVGKYWQQEKAIAEQQGLPNKAQWGNIRQAAEVHRMDNAALLHALFSATSPVINTQKTEWNISTTTSISLAGHLKRLLEKESDNPALYPAVILLASWVCNKDQINRYEHTASDQGVNSLGEKPHE